MLNVERMNSQTRKCLFIYKKQKKTNFCLRRGDSVEKVLASRPKLNVDDMFEEDLVKARHRAERAITEDAFFDSRGTRIPKSSINRSAYNAENDIDEEVSC